MDVTFKALIITSEPDGSFSQAIGERQIGSLPPEHILVRVRYSSLNYKDALSATGHKGVTRLYPHTPGIDAAGTVEESASPIFRPGDEVIVTGFDLGMNTAGGFAQYIRVPAVWALRLPAGLTLRQAMIYGTAGLTAALCVERLVAHGIQPEERALLVTGATGGVGSIAVGLLALAGYQVTAVTGKADAAEYLRQLGATEVMDRKTFLAEGARPLLKERWAGAVDTVGGPVLDIALKSLAYGGAAACCGMVASPELHTNVYPFILRGATLYGIDSVQCPMPQREFLWEKLSGRWKLPFLDDLANECGLAELPERVRALLAGTARGRTLVNVDR